jgi:IS4 transposase
MKGLKGGGYYEKEVYYKRGKELKALRICAVRKDKRSEEAGERRIKKENQHKRGGKEMSEKQKAYNKYILVATSLGAEVSVERVMELYRMRWQIELAFKRLKSLFQYGEVPSKLDESARAWFYGKLLLSALSETLVNEGRFSPLWAGQKEREKV